MKNTMLKALPLVFLFALAGCEKDGPMENAGEELDQAGENISESVEEGSENARDTFNQ